MPPPLPRRQPPAKKRKTFVGFSAVSLFSTLWHLLVFLLHRTSWTISSSHRGGDFRFSAVDLQRCKSEADYIYSSQVEWCVRPKINRSWGNPFLLSNASFLNKYFLPAHHWIDKRESNRSLKGCRFKLRGTFCICEKEVFLRRKRKVHLVVTVS